jgi:hypothetical protein
MDWMVVENKLVRTFTFPDFASGLAFVDRVARGGRTTPAHHGEGPQARAEDGRDLREAAAEHDPSVSSRPGREGGDPQV